MRSTASSRRPARRVDVLALLDAGVVARRPHGRQRIYRLDAAPLRAVHDWTAEYEETR